MEKFELISMITKIVSNELGSEIVDFCLINKARAVVDKTIHHWGIAEGDLSEYDGFGIVVAVLLEKCSGSEREDILYEVKVNKAVLASVDGVPVAFGDLENKDGSLKRKIVGIAELWRESLNKKEVLGIMSCPSFR